MEKLKELLKEVNTTDWIIVGGILLALIVGGLTFAHFRQTADKQIEAMLNAAKLQNPKITRGQFIRARGWETIDKQASDLYEEIQATDDYQRLEAEIERLENKGKDIDLIDSRRLRNLRADKAAMLHQISQQIYGSE